MSGTCSPVCTDTCFEKKSNFGPREFAAGPPSMPNSLYLQRGTGYKNLNFECRHFSRDSQILRGEAESNYQDSSNTYHSTTPWPYDTTAILKAINTFAFALTWLKSSPLTLRFKTRNSLSLKGINWDKIKIPLMHLIVIIQLTPLASVLFDSLIFHLKRKQDIHSIYHHHIRILLWLNEGSKQHFANWFHNHIVPTSISFRTSCQPNIS